LTPPSGAPSDASELRLDIWLWRARFYKTRSLAGARIAARGVRVTRNGRTERVDKPSRRVRAGDVLTFATADGVRVVEVLDLGVRRGPASEARSLYRNVDPAERSNPQCCGN